MAERCTACQYVLNILLGLDRLTSALLGGDGQQTISERLGEAERAGHRWARWLCRQLTILGKHHCAESLSGGGRGQTLWDWSAR